MIANISPVQKVAEGAVTCVDSQKKRQVVTGLEDVIAEDILSGLP
jgi:hypothetical protein